MINSLFAAYPTKYQSAALDSLLNDTLRFVDYYSDEKQYNTSYKFFTEDDNIVFKCSMPGLDQEHLDIIIENRLLKVNTKEEVKDIDFAPSFKKSFKLSSDVNCEDSFASLEKGILTITMPKKEGHKTSQIKFK
jgi:HSP20 family molecular chaperone IbpA